MQHEGNSMLENGDSLLSPAAAHRMGANRARLAGVGAGDRLAIISHELRNALGVVRNATRLLGRHRTDLPGVSGVQRLIERQVGLMNRYIVDLLEDPLVSTDSDPLHLQRTDLSVVVRNSIEAIAPDIALRRHRLTVTLPGEPMWLQVDGERLEQAFSNLLLNAAKYTPKGGDIEVILERRAEHACVCVRDSGIGMAEDLLPRIFGLYIQADDRARHTRTGFGIGLAVVRNFVELHGGHVFAVSAGPGKGSEFTVLLPAPRVVVADQTAGDGASPSGCAQTKQSSDMLAIL